MPVLPLDHPEPFAAILGIMLYPGQGQEQRRNADTFTRYYLAEPLAEYERKGHRLSPEQKPVVRPTPSQPPKDWVTVWRRGQAAGEVCRLYMSLAAQHHPVASINSARKIYERETREHPKAIRKNNLRIACRDFRPVMHLWAALPDLLERSCGAALSNRNFLLQFDRFLLDAHAILKSGQNWRQKRNKAEPLFGAGCWTFPKNWQPRARTIGWPGAVMVPARGLNSGQISDLKPSARPRKQL